MKVIITGDLCPKERVAQDFANGDYKALAAMKPFFEQVDYSIVNLECPILHGGEKPIIKNGPNLHADTHTLEALKAIGTDCVTLANNHFRDFGGFEIVKLLTRLHEFDISGLYGIGPVGSMHILRTRRAITQGQKQGTFVRIDFPLFEKPREKPRKSRLDRMVCPNVDAAYHHYRVVILCVDIGRDVDLRRKLPEESLDLHILMERRLACFHALR